MAVLSEKTKELAAVAASVAANCLPCLKYHFNEAVKQGCTIEEIREVIDIASMIKQRPSQDISKLALQLMGELKFENVKEERQ